MNGVGILRRGGLAPMFAKEIRTLAHIDTLLSDAKAIEEMQARLAEGDIYLIKGLVRKETIGQIRRYLEGIGKNSLPNYQAIEPGCPNFHRLNHHDERAYAKGYFHQFSFFPWNQDVFNFFDLFRKGYRLKNVVNNIQPDKYLGRKPEAGCIARVSFQFYPSGAGALNKHIDPVDHHQMAVPSLVMSKKGRDFQTGGLYLEKENGRKICVDTLTDVGDLVLFNATIPHGVETIDPQESLDWFSFKGRWMMIFATNKLSDNTAIADALDLEKVTDNA